MISPNMQGDHVCSSGITLIWFHEFGYFQHVHVCTLSIPNRKAIGYVSSLPKSLLGRWQKTLEMGKVGLQEFLRQEEIDTVWGKEQCHL